MEERFSPPKGALIRLPVVVRLILTVPASMSRANACMSFGLVVAIAAGMQPNLTTHPTEPVETITAFIVQVSLGDLPHGSIGYQSIYVAGLSLLVLTLGFNLIGFALRRRFREVY